MLKADRIVDNTLEWMGAFLALFWLAVLFAGGMCMGVRHTLRLHSARALLAPAFEIILLKCLLLTLPSSIYTSTQVRDAFWPAGSMSLLALSTLSPVLPWI